ncbi:x-ray induced transcript [Trifolium repens]|nr:x-ray induced transcript [Trifolium repens]
MDFNNSKHKSPWNWHREDDDYCLEKISDFDLSKELWNRNEDLSIMLDDETTPVKACVDFPFDVNNIEPNDSQKELEECSETSSQAKRRRMLQFNTQNGNHSLTDEQMSSAYLELNGTDDSNEFNFPEVSQWLSGDSENASSSNFEDLESAEKWFADCFKDTEMQICPDNPNSSGEDNVHIDATELCNVTPPVEQNVVQHQISQTPRKIVFRGRKSVMQTPTKLASTVAYPFAFIKPCGIHGDITLTEINKRIQLPPPSKAKQIKEDPIVYPKSAFSGKPVVGKTKIRTEGGKGSITIMRTRG